MRLVLVLLAMSGLAACSSTRDGAANFTGFTAGVTGAAALPQANSTAGPR
jgi:hypothetical protein